MHRPIRRWRRILRHWLLALIALTSPVVASPSADPSTSALMDLGGRTYRAEADGFKVTLAFTGDSVAVFLTTPGLIAGAREVCVAAVKVGVLATLPCDHGRRLIVQPTPTGYRVTLEGTLAGEARANLGPREYGPQGPTVYDAVPVNPVDVAFLDGEFDPPSGRGNSSAETKVLESFLPKPRPPPAPEARRRIEALLVAGQVDPMSVPLPVIRGLWRDIAEGRSRAGLQRRLDDTKQRSAKRAPPVP